MRHGRLTALAGAGAAALAAGAWLAVARLENAGGPAPGTGASGPVAAAATLPTPGPSGGLPEQAGGDGSSSADGSARRAARPSPHAPAAPFVQRFAAQPGVRPLPPRRSPTAKVSVPANVDGCDHNYGEKTQCIPARFPPDATDKCDWLKAHGFKTIRVVGTDRQKLDEDSDGVACNT
jgi:hypothetical protein